MVCETLFKEMESKRNNTVTFFISIGKAFNQNTKKTQITDWLMNRSKD